MPQGPLIFEGSSNINSQIAFFVVVLPIDLMWHVHCATSVCVCFFARKSLCFSNFYAVILPVFHKLRESWKVNLECADIRCNHITSVYISKF